jgi:hypothetical protein
VIKETHYYAHPVQNFQIMITNGGMIKSGGRCENSKLHMRNLSTQNPYIYHHYGWL